MNAIKVIKIWKNIHSNSHFSDYLQKGKNFFTETDYILSGFYINK